ncbi:MAG: PocR ligand-binding domain-containing protein [Campylobacterota bacterium]|nr:PocR ligand-binding domain-containing protein [Campylobacterota bacterium]
MKTKNRILELERENERLKSLLKINDIKNNHKSNIRDLVDIEQLRSLFEKFSHLTGYTTGFVKQDDREVLISTGWTDICKEYHRGSETSEHICKESNLELTKNLETLKEISLKECQHGMVDGATPIVIDGEHLADLFSGQVLFHKPDLQRFKNGANEFGYDMDAYLKALESVKVTSKEKLKEVLEFLAGIANLVAELGKEKKDFLELTNNLERVVLEKTKEQDMLLSLFDKGESVLFKWNNDEKWSVSYVSSSVEKLLGYKQDDFYENSIDYSSTIHKNDLAFVHKEVQEAIDKNLEYFKHEPYRIINKDGKIRWVLDYTVLQRNIKGEVTHFVGYINDITDEREQEKLIYEKNKMAQMGEMIGNIAHQWRQPLSVISTAASAIKINKELEILEDEETDKYMDTILQNTKYLSETIDIFRDFLKEEKVVKTVILQDRILMAKNIVKASMENNSIEIIDNIDYDSPVKIKMAIGELSQVIINILSNAKDILIERNIENRWVKISLLLEDKIAKIIIEDNGKGIDSDIFPKIFDPYFTTKHKSQGTGLGLHMSYKIITQSLHGKIYAKNTKDGVAFHIEIPTNL